MYRSLILQPETQSTAFKRWSEPESQPLQILDGEDWSEANLSVYRATRETKLQSLHFKIMNRVLPCNKFLKQIRIKSSDVCDSCGQVDSLLHFLYDCPTVREFWSAICRWFDGVENLALDTLSPKQFVFGVPRDCPKSTVINFILMNVKFFTFRQRLFHEGKLDLLHWLRDFRLKLRVERQIVSSDRKFHRFGKWTRIFNALG